MDMIEKVARAIDPFPFDSWQTSYDYEMAQSGDAEVAKAFANWSMGKRIEEVRQQARAAIDALKEPDAEMQRLGVEAYELIGIAGGIINTAEDHVTLIYQAMLPSPPNP